MKHFIFYMVTLLILPFVANVTAQSENLPPSDSAQVEAVMNQYFTALAGGDVASMKMLMGGRLKVKRTPLLNNPEYAGYLAATHLNASFQVLGMRSSAPNPGTPLCLTVSSARRLWPTDDLKLYGDSIGRPLRVAVVAGFFQLRLRRLPDTAT